MARYNFALVLGCDKVDQMTFVARMGMFGVGVVDAGQGA
jgi:hypothetical protein